MKALLVFIILEFIVIWTLFVGADTAAKQYAARWQEHYAVMEVSK